MMTRRLISTLLLLAVFVWNAQAQSKTSEEKAIQKAEVITKYINSKITDAAGHLTAAQTDQIKEAYVGYYADKAAYKKRKKEFMTTYKTWKAAVSKPVSAEEKVKLEEQKTEIAVENKALNKESKDMAKRREIKIQEALDEVQLPIFNAMRKEQASKSDDEE